MVKKNKCQFCGSEIIIPVGEGMLYTTTGLNLHYKNILRMDDKKIVLLLIDGSKKTIKTSEIHCHDHLGKLYGIMGKH